MLTLLRARPSFRRLWLAGTFSLIGDWLSFVAVSLLAVDKGGGALQLAIVFAVHALPQAFAMPIAGVVADRFDRRKLLVFAPLFQAALTLSMAFFAYRGELGPVQALLFARGMAAAFVVPAETAALRHTVKSNELLTANAVVSGTWSFAFVLGMALGGAIAVLGPAPAIVLDALTFLLAASLYRGLPSMRPDAASHASPLGTVLRNVPADLWAALTHARGRPLLFRAVFSKVAVAIAGGACWVVLNLVAGKAALFATAALSLGILQAVRGAGTGIGPLLAQALLSRRGAADGPSRIQMILPHVAVGLALLGIVSFPLTVSVPLLLVLVTFVWGMGGGANWVLSSAALQERSTDEHIGRLASIDALATMGTMIGGAFVAAVMLEAGLTLTSVSIAGAVLGLVFWVGLHFRTAHEPAELSKLEPYSEHLAVNGADD